MSYFTDLKGAYQWNNLNILYSTSELFYNNDRFSIKAASQDAISGTPTTPNMTILLQAMSEWSKIVNFGFSAATDYTTARLAIYQVADVLGGTADKPFTGVALPDQPLDTANSYRAIFVEANQSQYLYLHELGHALGLDHPLHGAGDAAGYNRDTTIMSYNVGASKLSANSIQITPMMFDIATIQQIYGRSNINTTTSGDTTYSATANTIPNSTLKTIAIENAKGIADNVILFTRACPFDGKILH